MKIHFLTIAQKELNDALDWYSEQSDGLGNENFSMNWIEPSAEPLLILNPVWKLNQD